MLRRATIRAATSLSGVDGLPRPIDTDDPAAAAQAVAQLVADATDAACSAAGRCDIALAGGEGLVPLLQAITALGRDWSGVHFWTGEEPAGRDDDDESTVRRLRAHLAAPGSVLHVPPQEGPPQKRATAYGFQLKDRRLDLAVLAIAADGRIGGLAPGAPALTDAAPIVALGSGDAFPGSALGLTAYRQARARVLVAVGGGRRLALKAALGEPSPSAPASLLPGAGTTVVADRDARG